jgi:hypothetical protein
MVMKTSKRGGRRPGAGRKSREHRSPTALSEFDIRAALAAPIPEDIKDLAQQHAKPALAALFKVVTSGLSDPARISAAGVILDRAYGRPAINAGGDVAMLPLPGLEPEGTGAAEEIRAAARGHATLCVECLLRICVGSQIEGARVAAARALLDRGMGVAALAKVPEDVTRAALGKRDQAVADARKAATGIYAPPPPPKGRLQ